MTKERLPKFWHDDHGDIRLLSLYPVEGYVMARRPGAAAFTIRVKDLREKFKVGRKENAE